MEGQNHNSIRNTLDVFRYKLHGKVIIYILKPYYNKPKDIGVNLKFNTPTL